MITSIYFFKSGYEGKKENDSKKPINLINTSSDKSILMKTTGMWWLDIFSLSGKSSEYFQYINEINWHMAHNLAQSLLIKIETKRESFHEDRIISLSNYNSFLFVTKKIVEMIEYIKRQNDSHLYYVWID